MPSIDHPIIHFEPHVTSIPGYTHSDYALQSHVNRDDHDHAATILRLSRKLRSNNLDHYTRASGFFSALSYHGLSPIIHDIDTNNGDISYSVTIGHIHLDGYILVAE